MMRLTESDLKFVVETLVTGRRDRDDVAELLRGKPDLVEPMLEDPKLTDRLISEHGAFFRVSPYLVFVFDSLSDKFNVARKALNVLSDRYLQPLRECYFELPSR